MSKVKIEGNASGTGTLTIAAPNTNSDYSVTLPEVSGGEFVVTDSSGNVGIGTSSPNAVLEVKNSANPNIRVGDGIRHLEVHGGSTTQNPAIGTYYAGDMEFRTDSYERMRIDYLGRVTMPYQPAFCAYGSSYSGTTFLGGNVHTNIGGHYNVTNGRFTAPVSGRYLMSFQYTPADSAANFVNMSINGNTPFHYVLNYSATYDGATNTLVLNLNAGDYVTCERRGSTGYPTYSSSFSGYLIG